jgi:hypothetical protein
VVTGKYWGIKGALSSLFSDVMMSMKQRQHVSISEHWPQLAVSKWRV